MSSLFLRIHLAYISSDVLNVERGSFSQLIRIEERLLKSESEEYIVSFL